MKSIIIAAGKGNRLYPVTEEIPKCLLDVTGKSILEHQLDNLEYCGIENNVAVLGYKIEKVEDIFGKRIKYVHNPFFQTTNSIVSLWLAKEYLNDDVLILNGDVLFKVEILKGLLNQKDDICMVVDRKKCNDEDYKVKIEDNRIVDMGKTIPQKGIFGEFIGITKASKNGAKKIAKILDNMMKEQVFNTWYETALLELVKSGELISFYETKGKYWAEIDYLDDLEKAREKFKA